MAQKKNLDVIISVKYDGKNADIKINNTKASIEELNEAVTDMNTGLSQTGQAMKATGDATGGATATVLELGRAISDANYGIRGYANNVSQLVSNFVFMTKSQDKATGAALGFAGAAKSVWRAIMGPLGIILAFQTAIAILESFAINNNKAEESVEDLEEGIADLNETIKDEIKILNVYRDTLMDTNTTLEERVGIVKGLSALDKTLAKQLKEANGDRKKEEKILENIIAQKEIELKIADKKVLVEEALARLQEIKNNDLFNEEQKTNMLAFAQEDFNRVFSQYILLYKDLQELQDSDEEGDKGKAPVFADPISDVDTLLENYDRVKSLEFELQRRRLESRQLYYDEARIQASEANNRILEDEIAHRQRMAETEDEGSMERIEAEHEIAMMRMDLQDQEFEHEMLLLDLRMQAQLEYIEFVSGLGQVFTTLGKESEALAKVGLVLQKGAAIAGVVIENSAANQKILAASATEVGFYKASAAATALASPQISAGFAKLAGAAEVGAAKRIAKNNIGAGIAIANILATTLTSRTAPSAGGRAGGGEGGGGRTFDFNLVGSTGTNQLAQAVGSQFQEPIQAYVVSSQITSQQELDLEISTGASLGG